LVRTAGEAATGAPKNPRRLRIDARRRTSGIPRLRLPRLASLLRVHPQNADWLPRQRPWPSVGVTRSPTPVTIETAFEYRSRRQGGQFVSPYANYKLSLWGGGWVATPGGGAERCGARSCLEGHHQRAVRGVRFDRFRGDDFLAPWCRAGRQRDVPKVAAIYLFCLEGISNSDMIAADRR